MTKSISTIASIRQAGIFLLVAGAAAIFTEMLIQIFFAIQHSVFDVVPSSPSSFFSTMQWLIYIFWLVLGVPSVLVLIASTGQYSKSRSRHSGAIFITSCIIASLCANAGLLFGGGWYAGTICADAGIVFVFVSLVMLERAGRGESPSATEGRKHKLYPTAVIGLVGCIAIVLSVVVPTFAGIAAVPAPLIQAEASVPAGTAPDYNNSFYILPIWEDQTPNLTYGVQQIQYLVNQVGGPNFDNNTGYVRIGRSCSCWYTNDIYDNGSFDPTNLDNTLALANLTGTPVLFHMNGGNWGQCCSNITVIYNIRSNASNCMWDQDNWCPPIQFKPGPNNRFWSLAPGTNWSIFQHTNIVVALGIIKAWWKNNPDLLAGFSTDSEIHEEDNFFTNATKTYPSYFDYSPLSIQQYREWAQANWTLARFNAMCGTNFTNWSLVDAPRSALVVGVDSNPWWQVWTEFRTYQVQQAVERECQWIFEAGFPRSIIYSHQILSPGDSACTYQRCDPLSTSSNPYCCPGVTRYSWTDPQVWYSIGQLSISDGSGAASGGLPSWGIFEWNLWTQHQYWAYMQMLDSAYQYGCHIICPNEWDNSSQNTGLWIPGYNQQMLSALQSFTALAQNYPRGSCPALRVNSVETWYYSNYNGAWNYFGSTTGLIVMAGCWGLVLVALFVSIGMIVYFRKQIRSLA
jgi:hypothetical protein